jgi:hypothetical protein
MNKSILNSILAAALCLGTALPALAQGQGSGGDDAFAKYDTDKDGKLSATELSKVTTKDGKKADLKEWDTDKDGSVSKAEFSAKYGGGGSPASPTTDR